MLRFEVVFFLIFGEYRAATAALVEKQSKEMINLINERKREFIQRVGDENEEDIPGTGDAEAFPYPQQAPPPGPPTIDKIDIYTDPLQFADIDQIAISVRGLIFKFSFGTNCM